MTKPRWFKQWMSVAWFLGLRVQPCPRFHVYATYLPRCPWCAPFPKRDGA
jgi:hypothetical protein